MHPGQDDLSQQLRVATTVCHEIVHQWFGNLVTPRCVGGGRGGGGGNNGAGRHPVLLSEDRRHWNCAHRDRAGGTVIPALCSLCPLILLLPPALH